MWNRFSSVSMKTIKAKLRWPGLHGKDFELPPHLVPNISSLVALNIPATRLLPPSAPPPFLLQERISLRNLRWLSVKGNSPASSSQLDTFKPSSIQAIFRLMPVDMKICFQGL